MLITGRGTSGSWSIRGIQLGEACGATVKPRATLADCQAADVIMVVKRLDETLLANVWASGKPWAYDVLDAFPQPECAAWDRSEAIAWVQKRIKLLSPTAVIWPNRRMREDCDTGLPGLVLPHHHRPEIKRNPIREQVQVVGYEGQAAYLGGWRSVLEDECSRRGWRFTVNPANLADLDIVVAFRGEEHNGYVQRHWKSGIKISNAHGSGTPFIGARENGYIESASGAEYWADSIAELRTSFDWLTAQSSREEVSSRFLEKAYSIDRAATELKDFMSQL